MVRCVWGEGGGEGGNVYVTLTSNMSSTLRGSTCTEFHRLTRCIRGVMVATRLRLKKLSWILSQVSKEGVRAYIDRVNGWIMMRTRL